jgi:hypothetical protein
MYQTLGGTASQPARKQKNQDVKYSDIRILICTQQAGDSIGSVMGARRHHRRIPTLERETERNR